MRDDDALLYLLLGVLYAGYLFAWSCFAAAMVCIVAIAFGTSSPFWPTVLAVVVYRLVAIEPLLWRKGK